MAPLGTAAAAGFRRGSWFFSLLTGAVLLTWLYNESRGSILVVALFHATVAVAFTSDVTSPFVVTATGALITLSGLAVLMIVGPRNLARTGKVVTTHEDGVLATVVHRAPP